MREMIVSAALFGLCVSTPSEADMTYPVVPYVIGFGYEVKGGFIKTDGTIGQINATHILDYSIVVDGPLPYTFLPANPISAITFTPNSLGVGLTATPLSLSLIDLDGLNGAPEIQIRGERQYLD